MSGTHVDGRNALPDDDRISLGVRLGWGGGSKGTSKTALSLGHWAAKPAVYIPQVLAIADEKTTALVEVNKTMIPSGSTIASGNGTVTVTALEPLAANPIVSVTKNGAAIGINPAQFSIVGNALLVHSLNLNPPATYVITLAEADTDQTFVTVVTSVGSINVDSITIDGNNSTEPEPEPTNQPPTASISNIVIGDCDGENLTFTVTYTDPNGNITHLNIFSNNVLVQTVSVSGASGSVNIALPSPSDGDVIKVIPVDANGAEGTAVQFTVSGCVA